MLRISELREETGLNMKRTSVELDIPYTTYVNYEKGVREPDSEMLVKLANYFNVSVDYLIGRSDDRGEALYFDNQFTPSEMALTHHERNVVTAYRDKPEMQPAVDKLLGVSSDENHKTYVFPTAARTRVGEESEEPGFIELDDETVKKIRKTPGIKNL